MHLPNSAEIKSALVVVAILVAPLVYTKLGSEHERLRYQNSFQSPEEVVQYYCSRDASGFVWSGLLEIERKAFTLWEEVPVLDSFFVAKEYRVGKAQFTNTQKTEAIVSVDYDVIAIADGNGTQAPVPSPSRHVDFKLKKLGGLWKIANPLASEMASVVLESKFPSSSKSGF